MSYDNPFLIRSVKDLELVFGENKPYNELLREILDLRYQVVKLKLSNKKVRKKLKEVKAEMKQQEDYFLR